MAKASKEPGDFAVLTHSGYRYEYHMTVQARSAHEARAIFKRSGDWRADNFRVRDDRKHGAAPAAETIWESADMKLSEPQDLLVQKMKGGAVLQHHLDSGLFRLRDAITTRTVHPATVESLVRSGVIIKSLDGSCRLA